MNVKTVLIVGALTDIGMALAQTLARQGSHCILLDKDSKKLDILYDELTTLGAASVLLCPLDRLTATPEHYEEIAIFLAKEYPQLDGIVFTEGAFVGLTPLEHLDIKKWMSVLHINLNAPFALIRACIPYLKKSPGCRILFTEGVAANANQAYWGPHCVAEYGIQGLCRVLNDELAGLNISATVIHPGPTRCTQRLKAFPAEVNPELLEIEDVIPLYLKQLEFTLPK